LPTNSEEMQVIPVALPPGRAMLATRLSSGSHDFDSCERHVRFVPKADVTSGLIDYFIGAAE